MDPTEDVMDWDTKIGVAKKLYYGGFFLLPWMWLANYFLFRKDLGRLKAPEELKTCAYNPFLLGSKSHLPPQMLVVLSSYFVL